MSFLSKKLQINRMQIHCNLQFVKLERESIELTQYHSTSNSYQRKALMVHINSVTEYFEIGLNRKLVRLAHNWNNGMLESWNDGFK